MEDLYKILGISRKASQDEIKKAYRALSKEHHPDKGGNEEQFVKIQQAYEVLSDEKRKAKYDATGSIEKEASFEQRFFGFVASQIIPMLEKAKDLEFDFMKKAKAHVKELISVGEENLKELDYKISHFTKAVEKIKKKNGGENVMTNILNSKIASMEKIKEQVTNEKAFIQECLTALDEYEYIFTESEPPLSRKGLSFIDVVFDQSDLPPWMKKAMTKEEDDDK